MGTTCCQGRGGKSSSPIPNASGKKENKRKRRASVRIQSLRTRGPSMSEPPVQPNDHPGESVQSTLLRMLHPEPRSSGHRKSDPTPDTVSEVNSPMPPKAPISFSDLSNANQRAAERLIEESGESLVAVYPLAFAKGAGKHVEGRALLSNSRIYLLLGDDDFVNVEERIVLESLAALCIQGQNAMCISSDVAPDEFMHLRGNNIDGLLKAVETIAHNKLGEYIPVLVFEDYGKMIEYAKRFSVSEIEELHSQEALKVLKLIMSTTGDLRESKLLQQACNFRGTPLEFLLTSKRFYLLSKDFRVVDTRRLMDISSVEFKHGSVHITAKDWRLEIDMQDCAKVIELARKSLE